MTLFFGSDVWFGQNRWSASNLPTRSARTGEWWNRWSWFLAYLKRLVRCINPENFKLIGRLDRSKFKIEFCNFRKISSWAQIKLIFIMWRSIFIDFCVWKLRKDPNQHIDIHFRAGDLCARWQQHFGNKKTHYGGFGLCFFSARSWSPSFQSPQNLHLSPTF